ncbi:MAG: SCO family protein [Actinomycetota bacterium]|nr:SCO family protein [Actinomycetota bacterium]
MGSLLLMCLVFFLVGCGSMQPTPSSTAYGAAGSTPPSFGTELNGPVPAALLSLPLVDSHGKATTLGSLRGKVVVLSDIMTLCQETCAIGTASMLQAARAIDHSPLGKQVVFLSVTIDPSRDDPHHLAAYQRLFGPLANWRMLTGSAANVDKLWNRLGVWRHTVQVPKPRPRDWLTGKPLTTDIQHTDDLIFIDAHQRFRFEVEGTGSVASAHAIPARIYRFMDRLGHQNVHRPQAGSWSSVQVSKVLHWLLPTPAGHSSGDFAHSADSVGVEIFPVAQRKPAPALVGTTLSGSRLSLKSRLGNGVVAVNVWASWCGPCRQEMPLLARADRTALRVVGLDERDQAGPARSFASSRGATYPSLRDPDGQLLRLLPMLPQMGVPSTVFIDGHGRIAARVVGPIDERSLRLVLSRIGTS